MVFGHLGEETRSPFLLDTGASVSVIPSAWVPKGTPIRRDGNRLQAAWGTPLAHEGIVSLKIGFAVFDEVSRLRRGDLILSHDFFVVSEVHVVLMGADVLAREGLKVDFSTKSLVLPGGAGIFPFFSDDVGIPWCRASGSGNGV